jgi:hypothetical protein
MDPKDSSTANNDDSAADDSAKPDYSSINDLDHEMSEDEEQAFINDTLGIKGGKDADKGSNDGGSDTSSNGDDGDKGGEDDKTADDGKSGDTSGDGGTSGTEDDQASGTDDKTTSISDEDKTKDSDKPAPELDENGIQTDDLWVEVEDSEGKSHKLVFDPQNPAAFLPDDFTFKNDKQLFEILDAKAEMAALYKERSDKFETEKETKTTQEQAEAQRKETLASWDAEIDDLIQAGALEAPKTKPGEKGWTEDPSVQKIDAIFKYMKTENDKRIADGKTPIKSFGTAFNLYSHDEQVRAEAEKEKKEAEDTKKRGALVGGSSAASSAGDKPMYTRGKYSDIWSVPVED